MKTITLQDRAEEQIKAICDELDGAGIDWASEESQRVLCEEILPAMGRVRDRLMKKPS